MSEIGRIASTIPHRAEQAAKAAVTTVAFMISPSPALAANAIQHPDSIDPTAQALRQPDQLPGSDIHVSRAARILLAKSTIKEYKSFPPEVYGNYTPAPEAWCTGVKVRLTGNNTGVSSSGHCFSIETGVENGLLSATLFPQAKALDFINRATFLSYTIDNPMQPVSIRQPLATVDGLAISTRSHDAALLKISPTATGLQTGPSPRSYDQLSSMPYSSSIHLVPGQEVGLFSVPESSDDLPVSSTGTYLGRVTDTEFENNTFSPNKLDVVLIHPKQPYEDPCYYAASGSSFVANEKTSTNTGHKYGKVVISGPLSRRVNTKYDAYLLAGSSTGQKARIQASLQYNRGKREVIKHQLRVAIKPDDTICEYEVQDEQTVAALEGAFGHFAPPLTGKGGGDPNNGTMR